MHTLEHHQSPDGLLRFIVLRDDDGDIALGFDGFAWHTHPEIFCLEGESKDQAVRRFVDELLAGRSIIAIARVGGHIRDIWVAEDATPDKYKPEDEVIEFRRWGGAKVPQG
jgi:hypothetical protein